MEDLPLKFALSGVAVLETGVTPAVAFAGRLLRGLGADVTQLDGAPSLPVDSTLWSFLNHGKSKLPNGHPLVEALADTQIWVDGRSAGAIRGDLDDVPFGNVHVAVTTFGLDGPWAAKAGSGIVAAALGGLLHICGDEQREPLKNGGFIVEFQTGLFAVAGALAGLLYLESTGRGLLVEASLLESVVAFQERADIAWTHQGANWRRSRRHEVAHPFTIFECADGYVTLAVGTPRHWANLCLLIGRPEWAEDVQITLNRHKHADLIDTALVPWLRDHLSAEIVRRCQELFVPCGPVLSTAEVLADAHLQERGFFQHFVGPSGAELSMPGRPFRTAFDWNDGFTTPAEPMGATS